MAIGGDVSAPAAPAVPKAIFSGAPQHVPPVPKAMGESWTLWQEAESMMASLDRVAAQVRHTRTELERNLMELERLIGSIPKRS